MYVVGAYIKLHIHEKIIYKNKWNLFLGLGSAGLIILSVFAFDFVGYMLKNNGIVQMYRYFGEYNTVFAVLCAVFIFLFFLNINFKSKIINLAAGSVLGIYLIHDNEFFSYWIWQVLYPNINYISSPYLHFICKVSGVFIVCLMIDLLRRATIGYAFDNWFYKNCDRIVLWFQKKKSAILRR